MSKKPIASIIIAAHAYNNELEACLKSILSNTFADYEVIVASEKKVPQNYISNEKINFLKVDKPVGPAKKRNLAVKLAKGQYYLFLDSDIIVDKKWLGPILNYVNKNPDIGAGQLKLLKLSKKNFYDCAGEKLSPIGFLVERAQSSIDKGQFNYVEDIFSGKTAAMIFRKDAFNNAGKFDDDYFYYWEEPDLCWRIWKSGYRIVFLPMTKIWHAYHQKSQNIDPDKQIKITYLGCRNQIMTIYKNGIGFQRLKMLFFVNTAWLILLILFSFQGKFRRSWAVVRAYYWLIINFKLLKLKRTKTKAQLGPNFYSDPKWMPKVKINRGFRWYVGKGISYLLGKPF